MQIIKALNEKVIQPIAGFVRKHTTKVVVAGGTVLGGASAHAEAFDASALLGTGATSAQTLFTTVATMSVGALVFGMVMRFTRKGSK